MFFLNLKTKLPNRLMKLLLNESVFLLSIIGQKYSLSNIDNFNKDANNILYSITYNPAFTISMNDEMMMI